MNIRFFCLVCLAAYVVCAGNNTFRNGNFDRNVNHKNNRMGKGLNNPITGFGNGSGFTLNMPHFWDNDESGESEDSDKDYYRSKQRVKGRTQPPKQKPIVSRPRRDYGNSQGYGFGGFSYNNNDKSRKYDYANRYANRRKPPKTDNVNNTKNIKRPGGIREGGRSVSFDLKGDSKGEKHYNDGGITIDGKRYPGQVKGNKGASQEFMGGGLTIDGLKIPGNVFGNQNIAIDRTPNGLVINGRIVPGVNVNEEVTIQWNQQGGIVVNGKKKQGFEDIKGKGRTFLAAADNLPTAGKRNRGPNVDMVGDHFTIDGKKVPGNSVQFTDDGVFVDGKRAPEYDVGNQRLNFDMTGDEIKINGQDVTGDPQYGVGNRSDGRASPIRRSERLKKLKDKKSPEKYGNDNSKQAGYTGGYTLNPDHFDDPTVTGNWVISGSNIGNVNSSKINEDNS